MTVEVTREILENNPILLRARLCTNVRVAQHNT